LKNSIIILLVFILTDGTHYTLTTDMQVHKYQNKIVIMHLHP